MENYHVSGLTPFVPALGYELSCQFYGDRVFGFLRFIPGGDLTGHFGLYWLLSFAVTSWLSQTRKAANHTARLIALALLATVVTLEEISQSTISTRTFSLQDLAASLAGRVTGLITANSVLQARQAPDSLLEQD